MGGRASDVVGGRARAGGRGCGWARLDSAPPRLPIVQRHPRSPRPAPPAGLVVGPRHHVARARAHRLVGRLHGERVDDGRRLGSIPRVRSGRCQGGQAPALTGRCRVRGRHLGCGLCLGRRVAHHLQGLGSGRVPGPHQGSLDGGVLLHDLGPQPRRLERVPFSGKDGAERAGGERAGRIGWQSGEGKGHCTGQGSAGQRVPEQG